MPQMAPIMWTWMFCFFLLIYLLFNIINYFSFLYQPNNLTSSIKPTLSHTINWKW